MIYIITPCTRTFNLPTMSASIPKEGCQWVISFDNRVKEPTPMENAINLYSPYTGDSGNPTRNFALESIKDQLKDDDWLYILDDDNIIHPNWYDGVKDLLATNNMIHWGQCFVDGEIRNAAADQPISGKVDTAQYMVRWGIAKPFRYRTAYEADGFYAEDCFNAGGGSFKIDRFDLCYYNFLRPNKKGDTCRIRICMITMFKNEAQNIRRMLDSVTPYIDYWVVQDNGSTDGTPEIVEQWAKETNIPGFMYKVDEGWVNFGWNRDHLLQTTLKSSHGCDWIMKMDCDETLEVDDGFDWSVFWTKYQSFHVTSVAPGLIYYRAWIWNASLPWKFNHDPAHETITLEMDGIGENFERHNLPRSFRMVGGQSFGESYSVPTKYVTDALKLEEKQIRENSMLTDLYHFWYIGKSYEDCYRGDFFPLKEIHQEEYAKRCIFYFENVVKVKHGGLSPLCIDEMAYYALVGIGNAYRFLKQYTKAIEYFEMAPPFCPVRNDHVISLAEVYWEMRDFTKMLGQTSIMMNPDRKCPFPEYFFLINTNMYNDTGKYPEYLHNIALENVGNLNPSSIFAINRKPKKRLFVVDNFYEDPYLVRNFALSNDFDGDNNWYKGKRSNSRHLTPHIKSAFESIIGFKITEWESHGMNGKLQYCTPQDSLVYHYDSQTWAAMIYLTPDAPFDTGTSFYAHKQSKIRHVDEPGADKCFEGGFYDSTKFELVDTVGNVFNRLVIFDARCFHAAHKYFGQTLQDSRLFHIFFFD